MQLSGKLATAPCGHDGEHVIGQYIRCLKGCDSVKKPAAPVKDSIVPPGYDEAEWFTNIVLEPYRDEFFSGVLRRGLLETLDEGHAKRAWLYGYNRRQDLWLDPYSKIWTLRESEKGPMFRFPAFLFPGPEEHEAQKAWAP